MRALSRMLLATAIFLFVLAGPAGAKRVAVQAAPTQPQTAGTEASSTAETEVKAVAMKLAATIVQGNWDELETHFSPEYSLVADTGKVKSKEDVMSDYRTGPRKIIVMELEELRARVYGETAVLQGRVTTSARESGHVNTRFERFTELYVKRDGVWLLVAEQETGIGK
jgi:hypothetical protein